MSGQRVTDLLSFPSALCAMGLSRLTTRQFERIRIWLALCILAGVAAFHPFVRGQAQTFADSATLQGTVQDSTGHPIAAVAMSLQLKSGSKTLSVVTDSAGHYRFSA